MDVFERSSARKLVDHASLVAPDPIMGLVEILLQTAVMFEPPEGRVGEKQELPALGDERLQMLDRCGAVRRVVAGKFAVVAPREVPRFPAFQFEQLTIALAHDE